jgi:Tol biopolymer transport system component/tRNA A-37 threonylcarbamoyl transferase component Bud32
VSDALDRLKTALADRYVIEREVGAGGMATVYLAEDVKHRRRVAVKVLRPELAATLGSERFFREIEVAARLQHPNILPLLDSGEAGGFLFYVMPYVEGESLRDRLAHHGELPIPDAVRVLVEVTDALAHAHAQGVVHRDIKPDNVLMSGRHALVTDFGVAKAVTEATGRQALTTAGVALGTPAYMAPEQAVADPHLDHRVDIYALGVLGYELLTGRSPFRATTPQEMLAAHVTQAPDPLEQYRPGVSPVLVQVVMKCLEKRPADRWQTADELLAQLEPLATPSGGMTPTQTRPALAQRRLPRWVPVAAAAVVVTAAGALGLFLASRPGPVIVLGRRFAVATGPELETWPSLSPDGKIVIYTRQRGTVAEQMVQQVDGGTPVALTEKLPGSHGLGALSPDGGRVLFLSADGLATMPALGGQMRVVVANARSWAAWSPDGSRIAYSIGAAILRQALDGSAPDTVAVGLDLHSPAWSSDGRWIAYVEGNSGFHTTGNLAPSNIRVVPAGGGRPVSVTEQTGLNTSPVWVPLRRSLLFVSDREGGRDIYQVDLTRSGAPARPPLRITTGLSPERLAISADGRRLAWSVYTESANIWAIAIPARDSVPISDARAVTSGTQNIETVAVSRDGAWLYYDSDRGGTSAIWRQPLAGGPPEQLTNDPAPAFSPAVSPDGRTIAFHSFRFGNRDIFVIGAAGGREIQVTHSPQHDWNPSWGADGASLVWDEQLNRDSALWTARRNPDGSWGVPRLLAGLPNGGVPRVSPDGVMVVYSGPAGLALLRIGDGISRYLFDQPNRQAGDFSAWAPDSRTVYFATPSDTAGYFTIKSVPVAGGPARTLVYGNDPVAQAHRYGFATDGKRFYFPLAERKADIWVAEVRLK